MEEAVISLAGLLLGAVTWGVTLQLKVQRAEKDLALATVAYERLRLDHERLKDSVAVKAMSEPDLAESLGDALEEWDDRSDS